MGVFKVPSVVRSDSDMDDPFSTFTLAAAVTSLESVAGAAPHADALEFRMDRAERPLAALDGYRGQLPIIATNRAAWEGGDAAEAGRLELLARAIDHEAVIAIDVELESIVDGSATEPLEAAAAADVAVIASTHDFSGTPSEDTLRDRLETAADRGDVGKLAVTATSPRDVLDLLSATDTVHRNGGRVATMAMGAIGSHSRVVAPIYGSRIGYAPIDPAEATAPGQLDLATMRAMVDRLLEASAT